MRQRLSHARWSDLRVSAGHRAPLHREPGVWVSRVVVVIAGLLVLAWGLR